MSLSTICRIAKQGISWHSRRVFSTLGSSKNVESSWRVSLSAQRIVFVRQTSTSNSPKPEVIGPKKDFITIYRFPYARFMARVCQAKRISIVLGVLIIPSTIGLSLAGFTTLGTGIITCGSYALVILKLYLLSLVSNKFVGFVYASPDMKTVQIAYIDETGRRKEDIFPTTDLVPLSELPERKFLNLYFRLQRYSRPPSEVYKLTLTRGKITNKDMFCTIFGKVD